MPSPWPDLTVPYAHAWTEIHKGIDTTGPYYKVMYYIEESWATADQVVNELLGFSAKQGGSIYFQGPHQYPLDPTGRSLCFQADVVGAGNMIANSDGYPQYDGGFFVEALYRVPPIPMYAVNDPDNLMGIDPGTPLLWCSQDVDFIDNYILLENSQYIYSSDSAPSNVPVRIPDPTSVLELTFHRVPYNPYAVAPLIRSLRGQTNNATFLGAAQGTVLFKGARTHRESFSGGSYVLTVQLIFHEKNQDWNKIFRPDTCKWDLLVAPGGGGVLPYTQGTLSNLLKLGQTYTAGS